MDDGWLPLMIAVAIILIVAGVVSGGIAEARAERICLRHGFPSADWRLVGPSYCIKRVNQTDVVVQLDSLR